MTKSFHKRIFFLPVYAVAWVVVKLYHLTCRVEVKGPLPDHLNDGRPILLAWWHQDMLFNFVHLTRFARQRKIATIVSQSKDGDLAAYLVEKFGMVPIRGSSSKGGKEALDLLARYILDEQAIGVLVCDGPRPPARVAKFGIAALGRKTGVPIMAIRSWGTRQFIFHKSWCKLLLVSPFSRVTLWSEAPFFVPANTPKEALEHYRLEIETRLNALAELSESAGGSAS